MKYSEQKQDKNLSFQVLAACMGEGNESFVKKINLNSDAVIVDQCDSCGEQYLVVDKNNICILFSSDRGISKSRNLAIKEAKADICLFCDDDEILFENTEEIITDAFMKNSRADVIIFNLENWRKNLGVVEKKLRYTDLFKVSSVQIAIRRKSVVDKEIYFDELLGVGSGNGAEEEFKFLLDCRAAGLEIYYNPKEIAYLNKDKSSWFSGYTEKFFYDRGRTTRYIMGYIMSQLYAFYYIFTKSKMYRNEISVWKAFKAIEKGIHGKRIKR